MWGKISRFVGFRDETGLVVRIGLVVGIGLFGGTGLVVSLTYITLSNDMKLTRALNVEFSKELYH